jgi:fructosamine-3-kinase
VKLGSDHPAHQISELISKAVDLDVITSSRLSGGEFASSHQAELADGRFVFAKTHHNPPPRFFTTEAAGLGWLRDSGSVAVPELLHVSDSPPLLVLEWVAESRSARPDEAEFGRELAALHSQPFDTFGRPDENTTGSQGLPNNPTDSWAEFFAEQRLLPLARLALDRRRLQAGTVSRIETLANRIQELLLPAEPPSLLHGDLWAGNRIVDTSGKSWVIDPACFGGHREFDLAMMKLFGGFADGAFAAYDEAFPLSGGWQHRIALHQLPPLIVHAIKFGGSYVAAVEATLSQY